MDFSALQTYIERMVKHRHLILGLALSAPAMGAGQAQPGAATVQQISPRPAASAAARVAPVRGAKSSAAVQERPREGGAGAVVPPEMIEACRKAQAEDRPAPAGMDCLAVAQALAQPASLTAEAALLPLFGQSGDVTGTRTSQAGPSVNADDVARRLSTGEVQGLAADGVAAIVGRERAAPPPNSPR